MSNFKIKELIQWIDGNRLIKSEINYFLNNQTIFIKIWDPILNHDLIQKQTKSIQNIYKKYTKHHQPSKTKINRATTPKKITSTLNKKK